jgi:maltodextrin utilization protein YvdJ
MEQEINMTKLLKEINDDLNFIKSHSLQPQWYKALKVFILVGFLVGYYYLFGFMKTVIFFVVFLFLSLLVHLTYRVKTNKWKRSWLDFVVVESNDGIKAKSIGKFYYSAIVLNTLFSVVISQMFPS